MKEHIQGNHEKSKYLCYYYNDAVKNGKLFTCIVSKCPAKPYERRYEQ